jgi:hypothetical protein
MNFLRITISIKLIFGRLFLSISSFAKGGMVLRDNWARRVYLGGEFFAESDLVDVHKLVLNNV